MANVDALTELAETLEALTADLERRRDSRCVFTQAYTLMTQTLAAELRGASAIPDPDWVIQLALAFADEYVGAVEGYDHRDSIPVAWQVVSDGICKSPTAEAPGSGLEPLRPDSDRLWAAREPWPRVVQRRTLA